MKQLSLKFLVVFSNLSPGKLKHELLLHYIHMDLCIRCILDNVIPFCTNQMSMSPAK